MKAIRLISYLSVLSLVLLVSSCSKQENTDVLSTIPAESSIILRINARTILESAGCVYENDSWQTGTAVDAFLKQTTASNRYDFNNLMKLLPAVENQSLYVFSYNNSIFATCHLLNKNAVASALANEFGKPENQKGFDVYQGGLVMRDNQLWITDGVEALENALKEAAKASALSVKQMSALQKNGSNNVLTLVTNNRQMANLMSYLTGTIAYMAEFQDSYDVYDLTLDGPELKGTGVRYDLDGAAMSIASMLDKIDPSFGAQMPANAIMATAFGKPSEEFMNSLFNGLIGSLGQDAYSMRPFFDAFNGTFSLSVAPPQNFTRLLHWEDWRFTVTAQYDKDKAQELIAMAAPLKQLNISLGYENGMLVLTNTRADERKASHMNFFKDYAGFFSELDPKGEIATGLGLPFGFKMEATAEEKVANFKFSLVGTDQPMLEAILTLATDTQLQRQIMTNFMQLDR